MKKINPKSVALALVLCVSTIIILAQVLHVNKFDPGLVDESCLSLKTPYKSVVTHYYYDGGSIGVEIVDNDGREEKFFFPVYIGDKYSHLYKHTAYDITNSSAKLIASPKREHTKKMLIQILYEKSSRSSVDDMCLMNLHMTPANIFRCAMNRINMPPP